MSEAETACVFDSLGSDDGIPFFITGEMRQRLRGLGLSDDEIRHMTPAVAHARLKGDPPERTALDWAREYKRRGWAIVPIPPRSKGPNIPNWTQGGFKPEQVGFDDNVGCLLGEKSNGLIDIDLDCRDALYLAGEYLPPTGAVFGRPSNPGSHHLFYAPGSTTKKFNDPIDNASLVELRSTGTQTVFPGSIHPEGEPISWVSDHAPATVTAADLLKAVSHLAAATLVAKHFPKKLGTEPESQWPDLFDDPAVVATVESWLGFAPKRPAPSLKDALRAPLNGGAGGGRGYGPGALDDECAIIARAGIGSQNTRLNTGAFRMGQLVGGGELDQAETERRLVEAGLLMVPDPGKGVWTRRGVERVVQSGMQAGMQNPRSAPERPEPAMFVARPSFQGASGGGSGAGQGGAASEGQAGQAPPPLPRLALVDPTTLLNKPVPIQEWMVEQWMPMRQTTALYGDGATGKTLLAQLLGTCCAVGLPWLGLSVRKCRVLIVLCEDDEDVVHRRQADINAALGVDFDQIADLRWVCRVGLDNLLMRFEGARNGEPIGTLTGFWEQVRIEALDFGAQLVILDTAADTFGGNENVRPQVRQFVQQACTRLAQEINGAVLLCAHPSVAGMANGTGTGGSTAWNNSVRSRWYLTRPAAVDGEEIDDTLRTLSMRKANYARQGEELELQWHQGVFRLKHEPYKDVVDRIAEGNREREAETAFLRALRALTAEGRAVSHAPIAKNYAPKVISKRLDAKGLSVRDLAAAMERLFETKRIVGNARIGVGKDRHPLKGIAELSEASSKTSEEEL